MEDVAAILGVKLGHLGRTLPFQKTAADDPAGRGAGDQVEKITSAVTSRLFDPLEKTSRDDPPDTAAIDAQNANDLFGHCAPSLQLIFSRILSRMRCRGNPKSGSGVADGDRLGARDANEEGGEK